MMGWRVSSSPQKCSPGFYREPVGPYRGQCVPCSCSGFSSECDGDTGNCLVGVQIKQQQSEGSLISSSASQSWGADVVKLWPQRFSQPQQIKHVWMESININGIGVTCRTVGSTPPVSAVSAVKRVILEVRWTRRARPVRAPPPGTSLLLLLLLFLVSGCRVSAGKAHSVCLQLRRGLSGHRIRSDGVFV